MSGSHFCAVACFRRGTNKDEATAINQGGVHNIHPQEKRHGKAQMSTKKQVLFYKLLGVSMLQKKANPSFFAVFVVCCFVLVPC